MTTNASTPPALRPSDFAFLDYLIEKAVEACVQKKRYGQPKKGLTK